MEDTLISVMSLGFFALLFGFIVLMRFLNYRETMALAEKGLVRADTRRGNGGKDTLRWGIVITAVGLALCIGLYPIGFVAGSRFLLGFGPWMLAGLLPTFFGLGLVLIYVLTREKDEDPAHRPTPPADRPRLPSQDE
jgi:hypothetical protein